MSLTATKLSENIPRDKAIDAVSKEQLQIIDARLSEMAQCWGWNVLTYDLPNSFGIPGLTKTDAQRAVYSKIISSLRKRGFTVRLLLEAKEQGDLAMLYIGWVVKISEVDMAKMNDVIKSARLQSRDVGAFLKGDMQ